MAGGITLRARLKSEDEHTATVEFSVTDTGIGIRAEKLPGIFESFQQASDDTSRLFGGTGLGLAIVKQLVEPQGGSVVVTSHFGQGSVFSFILPYGKTQKVIQAELPEPGTITQLGKVKLLVVEDIPLNQFLMETLLEGFGFECEIAGNGQIAIRKLQDKAYDIVLMDLHMPVMNGFEATEFIRGQLGLTVPIIALTADVTNADIERCRAVGMTDYVAKPVDERLLYARIASVMTRNTGRISRHEPLAPATDNTGNCTDLTYLRERTKANPKAMIKMLNLYLNQTPGLVECLKTYLVGERWEELADTAHKMIPSFAIVGMDKGYTNMASRLQQLAASAHGNLEIPGLVRSIDMICTQACKELKDQIRELEKTDAT
jgi:CheY-like chemotaxis protein/HPt (histidine-containing phosphotransfer) domain-containing protein